jgi:hypothetical protein
MKTTLAARLRAFVQTLAQRPDIVVLEHDVRPGLSPERADDLREEWFWLVPEELVQFAREIGGLTFTWALASRAHDLEGYSEGSRGGRLNLGPFEKFSYLYNNGNWPSHAASFAPLDRMVAEGLGGLMRPRDLSAPPRMVFDDSSANKLVEMDSWERYVTRGARSAFCWFWQVDDRLGREILAQLRSQSLTPDVGADALRARLLAAGLERVMADEMLEWLGADAVLLFAR